MKESIKEERAQGLRSKEALKCNSQSYLGIYILNKHCIASETKRTPQPSSHTKHTKIIYRRGRRDRDLTDGPLNG